jgi:predicted transposase YdaD
MIPLRIDHDGLAKRLLTAFLREFLELFLPDALPYTDLSNVTFLDKELPRANPKSKKRAADLVAQVKFRGQDAFFLFHIEPQGKRQEHFNFRMHRYYGFLLDRYKLPIYPIALLTFTSPRAEQPTSYAINFPGFEVLRFNYRVIQLNRLAWQDFVNRPNPVAAALMSRMKIAKKDRPRVKAECLAMLLGLELDEAKEELVWEIVDTYLPLDEKEGKTFQRELDRIAPEEEETKMEEFLTRRQRGRLEGRAEGIQEMALRLIRRRFGSADASLQEHIQRLRIAQLEQLTEDLLDFATLADVTAWLDQHAPDTMAH